MLGSLPMDLEIPPELALDPHSRRLELFYINMGYGAQMVTENHRTGGNFQIW
jgi:hypothetical protein